MQYFLTVRSNTSIPVLGDMNQALDITNAADHITQETSLLVAFSEKVSQVIAVLRSVAHFSYNMSKEI